LSACDKALTNDEWWRLMRYAEGIPGKGPLTGLPLAAVHPTAMELVRVRDLMGLWLMGHAGLRVGELVKLRWEDVWRDDQAVSRIAVGPLVGKGGFSRFVPVDTFVAAALARVRSVAGVVRPGVEFERVFGCGPLWRRIGVRVVQRKVSELGVASLGRALGCHQLRHTFAVRVRRASDTAVLQGLLGHRRLASTQVYVGVTAEEAAKAVGSLAS